jgi:hypothetical protein
LRYYARPRSLPNPLPLLTREREHSVPRSYERLCVAARYDPPYSIDNRCSVADVRRHARDTAGRSLTERVGKRFAERTTRRYIQRGGQARYVVTLTYHPCHAGNAGFCQPTSYQWILRVHARASKQEVHAGPQSMQATSCLEKERVILQGIKSGDKTYQGSILRNIELFAHGCACR